MDRKTCLTNSLQGDVQRHEANLSHQGRLTTENALAAPTVDVELHTCQAPGCPLPLFLQNLSVSRGPLNVPRGTARLETQTPTLGLDGVEERKFILVEALKSAISQGRHRQGLKV